MDIFAYCCLVTMVRENSSYKLYMTQKAAKAVTSSPQVLRESDSAEIPRDLNTNAERVS